MKGKRFCEEMEPNTGEPRGSQMASRRALNGERSPGGSVKRARERAAAGLPPEAPSMQPNQRSNPTSPPRRSPQKPSSPTGQPYTSPRAGQALSPQRRPRPNHVPPNLQNQPGGLQPPQNYWEEGHDTFSGYSSSSRTSTTATDSSTTSIPDFPQIPHVPSIPPMTAPIYQQPPLPPRRNLGPPPSARRGVSSYYSQNSFVPPIPEERSETHSSYASSHTIPESWGNGPPGYSMGAGIDEEDEEQNDNDVDQSEGSSGRQSRASDDHEQSSLVRGPPRSKPLQPFMDPIESGDESDRSRGSRGMRELDWQARQDERFRSGFGGGKGPGTDPIGRHNFKDPGNLQHPYSGYESDATFLDSPRSVSPSMAHAFRTNNASNPYIGTPTSAGSPVDPRVGQILGNLEKGGALASSRTPSSGGSSTPPMNEKGPKRPPPLNLEGSRASPARSSASSLPELIRRATRLASNLDRGKTASRLGMLDMLNKKDMERREEAEKASKNGSISDMLAAFPSPSPTTTAPSKPGAWGAASPYGKSNLSRAQTITYGSMRSGRTHRGRRICGLPVWGFILLVIILILLVAAAVVIPTTLIVIPRQNSRSPTVDSCRNSDPCANGGSALVIDEGCRCICARGFTGSNCDTPPDNSCATINIPVEGSTEVYVDSTLGNSVTRILSAASTNYSIPLSGYKLAALFSYTNLSCSSENALITLNGRTERRRSFADILFPPPNEERQFLLPPSRVPVPLAQILTPSPSLPTSASHTLQARALAQSSNGIVFAAGGSPAATDGSIAPTNAHTPAPVGSAPEPTPTVDSKPITPTVLDFARTAILFIFQETGDRSAATAATERLQLLLSGGETYDASQTSVGGSTTVDLSALTVRFGNGTVYGGRG